MMKRLLIFAIISVLGFLTALPAGVKGLEKGKIMESKHFPHPEHETIDEPWLLAQSTEYHHEEGWQPYIRLDYEYDTAGRVILLMGSELLEGNWVATSSTEYYYSSGGLLQETLSMAWYYGIWHKQQRVSYTYNGSDRLTRKSVYSMYNNEWRESWRGVYAYNSAGLLDTENEDSYNYLGMIQESSIGRYHYNAALQLIELNSWYIIGDWEFAFESRQLYSYNPDGSLAMVISQEPQGGNYQWQDTVCHLYTYTDGGLLSQELLQTYYTGTGWNNWYQYLYAYDPNGSKIEALMQEYDEGWQNDNHYLYTRDAYGNAVEILYQEWVQADWQDMRKWERVFIETELEDELIPTPAASLHCRPNPFSNSTGISYELKHSGPVVLEIYNIKGQRLAALPQGIRQAGPNAFNWNGRNSQGRDLPAGIYIIQVKAEGRVAARGKVTRL